MVLAPASEVTRYTYDLVGNLDELHQPNGAIAQYTYDALNRLDLLTHYKPDSTPQTLADNDKLAQFDYTVRPDGKRTSVVEDLWISGVKKTTNITWQYDELGRLIDEAIDHFDNNLDQTDAFLYDLVGNRLSRSTDLGNDGSWDKVVDAVFDSNDRLERERIDLDDNGSIDQEIVYQFAATQQSHKVKLLLC